MNRCVRVERIFISNKQINLIVTGAALIGIVLQLFDQTSEFFTFPIYSQVDIVPTRDRLPAITFCIAVWYSEFHDEFTAKSITEASKFAPDLNKTLVQCKLTLPNGTFIDCFSITKVHKFMNSRLFCYSMFEENRTSLDDQELMYSQEIRLNKTISTPLISIKLISPYINSSHWALTVRNYDKPLTILRSTESKNWIEPEVNNFVALNYKVIDRWLLPAPYPSNCHNYGNNYDSVYSLTNCWLQNLVDSNTSTRYWPEWTLYDYERNYSREGHLKRQKIDPSKMHWPGKNVSRLFSQINEKCHNSNGKSDCRRRYILLNKIGVRKAGRNTTVKGVTIEVPWVPRTQVIIEQKAKLDLIEFLSEVGGIFSMWIGFSMYISLKDTFFHSKLYRSRDERPPTAKPPSPPIFVSRRVQNVRWHMRTVEATSRELFMRKVNQVVKVANLLVKFWCVLLTSFFVYEIIFIYFERPFNTLLNSSIPKEILMTPVTLCVDMIIYPSKMQKFYPEIYQKVAPRDWRNYLTIGQLFNVTINWSDIYVNSSSYISPFDDNVRERTPIHEDFTFTKSLTGRYVCFSTFSEKQMIDPGPMMNYDRSEILYAVNFDIKMDTDQLLKLKQGRIRGYIHTTETIEEDFSAPERITMDINPREAVDINSYVIRVSRTIESRYPNHIRSTCMDYKRINFRSQKHALDTCVIKKFVNKYKLWPSGYQISDPLNYTFSSLDKMKDVHQIENNCSQLFSRQDCRTVHLTVKVEDEFFKHNFTSLINYPPSKQFYEYKEQLVYSVIDILGFTGGTINAWIGLSFLDVKVVIILVCRWMKQFYFSSQT